MTAHSGGPGRSIPMFTCTCAWAGPTGRHATASHNPITTYRIGPPHNSPGRLNGRAISRGSLPPRYLDLVFFRSWRADQRTPPLPPDSSPPSYWWSLPPAPLQPLGSPAPVDPRRAKPIPLLVRLFLRVEQPIGQCPEILRLNTAPGPSRHDDNRAPLLAGGVRGHVDVPAFVFAVHRLHPCARR